jgi:hypothetical protein
MISDGDMISLHGEWKLLRFRRPTSDRRSSSGCTFGLSMPKPYPGAEVKICTFSEARVCSLHTVRLRNVQDVQIKLAQKFAH